MAASSQSQHRCVFVGNIPYDATEEQLIQICEEVGPVVSFRLVIDRETGKPKGYGFCEYKDEETALSARRNLQGYDINGRQLRVDFAENDKNADRSREQGRIGTLSTTDPQNPLGSQTVVGDPSIHHPVGASVAMAAANVMAGVVGVPHTANILNKSGLQTQSVDADPLTSHLAMMSRSQLSDIMSEFKVVATQNEEQARQLLLNIPSLARALFQAQIIMGIVPPQWMSNVRQATGPSIQPLKQSFQTISGLPPHPQANLHLASALESSISKTILNQYAEPRNIPTPSQIQSTESMQNQVLLQGKLVVQPTASQHSAHSLPTSAVYSQPISLNVSTRPSLNQSQFSTDRFESILVNRAPKLVNLNDTRGSTSLQDVNTDLRFSGSIQASDLLERKVSLAEGLSMPKKQAPQMYLPNDLDSALLEQVKNLTPEQLSSLPPDQLRQVIQLQNMLRQAL